MIWKGREETYKKFFKVKRIGEPKDVSGVIVFLASEDADYINGETIVISGSCNPNF